MNGKVSLLSIVSPDSESHYRYIKQFHSRKSLIKWIMLLVSDSRWWFKKSLNIEKLSWMRIMSPVSDSR